jgi:hypothetical protein
MYTSYEDRLSFLKQFHQGAEAFSAKIPEAVITHGDGWKLIIDWFTLWNV